jgi:hypothetical protein
VPRKSLEDLEERRSIVSIDRGTEADELELLCHRGPGDDLGSLFELHESDS